MWMAVCAALLVAMGLELSENCISGSIGTQLNGSANTSISFDKSGMYQEGTFTQLGKMNAGEAKACVRKVAGRLDSVLEGKAYAAVGDEFTVTYEANGGTFSGGETTNTVTYRKTFDGASLGTKYSHTSNISDNGTKSGNYANNLATKNVVTLPGARSLRVKVTYGTENNWDMLYIFQGEYTGNVTRNMSAGQLYKLTGGSNTTTTVEYDIEGDTATFAFYSDSSGAYYGYYAIVTANDAFGEAAGTYEVPAPASSDDRFKCWNTVADGSGQNVAESTITSDMTVYAQYEEDILEADAKGTTGTCSWIIKGDGTLIIYPTDNISGTLPSCTVTRDNVDVAYAFPWFQKSSKVKKVVVKPGVKTSAGANSMFSGMSNCTEMDLSGLDTSDTTKMKYMFSGCSSLQSLDVSDLDTGKVTDMGNMFYNCSKLTGLDLSTWDTSNVTTMYYMFYNCENLTSLGITGWNTGSVTNMEAVFRNCSNLLNLDVSGFDTRNVTTMNQMFSGCAELSGLDVSEWDTGNVTNMQGMFSNCGDLTNLDISNFNTSNVTSISSMFSDCKELTSLDVSGWDTSKVTYMNNMFSGCSGLTSLDVSEWDTDSLTGMSAMFQNCSNLTTLDVSKLETGKVTDMNNLFSGCSELTSLNLSGWDTGNVTAMNVMFKGCSKLTSLKLSDLDTGNVTNMYGMFSSCSNLKSIDMSGWDTGNVTTMKEMFSGCTELTALDLSSFDTGKVTNMQSMFDSCKKLQYLDLSSFNTSAAYYMLRMMDGCDKISVLYLNAQTKLSSDCHLPDIPEGAAVSIPYGENGKYRITGITTGKWTKQYPTNHAGQRYTSSELINASHTEEGRAILAAGDLKQAWYWEINAPSSNNQAYTSIESNWTTSKDGVTALAGKTPEYFANSTGQMLDAGYWNALSPDTWQYTFYVMNDNLDWYVYEERMADYIGTGTDGYTVEGAENSRQLISRDSKQTTIVNTSNTRRTGRLDIKKTVTDMSNTPIDDNTLFHFTVKLKNEKGDYLTGIKMFGDTMFYNGKANVSIGNGEIYAITDIPEGYSYEVAEEDYKEYTTESVNASGSISANITQTVSFTNKKNIQTDFVDVTIAKRIDGHYETSNETYQFSATLSGLTALTTYELSDGKTFASDSEGSAFVEFNLTAGSTISILQIPVGAKYAITEQGGNYAPAFTITNGTAAGSIYIDERSGSDGASLSTATETAELDEETTVTFTNTLNHTVPLHLTKRVAYPEGYTPSEHAEFEIRAHFDNLPAGYHMTTSAGAFTADNSGHLDITFYVTEGETIDIDAVPVLATYSFEEPAAKDYTASYAVTDANALGKIADTDDANDKQNAALSTATETANEGEDVTVQFTNTVPALFIEKSVTNATGESVDKYTQTVDKGAMLTYTLTVTNAGSTPITTTVVDPLPDDMTFVEASDGGTLRSDTFEFEGTTYTGRNIVWPDITVPANSTKTFMVKVQQN